MVYTANFNCIGLHVPQKIHYKQLQGLAMVRKCKQTEIMKTFMLKLNFYKSCIFAVVYFIRANYIAANIRQ